MNYYLFIENNIGKVMSVEEKEGFLLEIPKYVLVYPYYERKINNILNSSDEEKKLIEKSDNLRLEYINYEISYYFNDIYNVMKNEDLFKYNELLNNIKNMINTLLLEKNSSLKLKQLIYILNYLRDLDTLFLKENIEFINNNFNESQNVFKKKVL